MEGLKLCQRSSYHYSNCLQKLIFCQKKRAIQPCQPWCDSAIPRYNRTVQRPVGIVAVNSHPPSLSCCHVSSSHASAPLTTMLGRNRFMGMASGPLEFNSAKLAYSRLNCVDVEGVLLSCLSPLDNDIGKEWNHGDGTLAPGGQRACCGGWV